MLYTEEWKKWKKHPNVEFSETVDVAKDGWKGHVGVVTTIMDDVKLDTKKAYAVSCGPPIMLKFVTQKCLELGFKSDHIYLSMNRKMSCGVGICGRCNIGPYYLCKDGPDMCYEKIKDYEHVF